MAFRETINYIPVGGSMPVVVGGEAVVLRLRERYGIPEPPPKVPPLDELVRTILSQNTNDRNRDKAYETLCSRFEDWRGVLNITVPELAVIIAPAGLGPTKAQRIHDLLEHVYLGEGGDLLEICSMEAGQAMERLLSIKGVGPKTAACVVLFSCEKPAFPVDTHIHRIAGRLGLVPGGSDRVRSHDILARTFPADRYLEIHLNMIRLGREVCRAAKPSCPRCPLADMCPSATI
jgi:endonuclease-3